VIASNHQVNILGSSCTTSSLQLLQMTLLYSAKPGCRRDGGGLHYWRV